MLIALFSAIGMGKHVNRMEYIIIKIINIKNNLNASNESTADHVLIFESLNKVLGNFLDERVRCEKNIIYNMFIWNGDVRWNRAMQNDDVYTVTQFTYFLVLNVMVVPVVMVANLAVHCLNICRRRNGRMG